MAFAATLGGGGGGGEDMILKYNFQTHYTV